MNNININNAKVNNQSKQNQDEVADNPILMNNMTKESFKSNKKNECLNNNNKLNANNINNINLNLNNTNTSQQNISNLNINTSVDLEKSQIMKLSESISYKEEKETNKHTFTQMNGNTNTDNAITNNKANNKPASANLKDITSNSCKQNKTEMKASEEKSKINNEKNLVKEQTSENSESLELSYIRLNRSCEATYIRQNMEQFDIEYMCRCLGIALMKHVESSKEKNHVMDLVDNKQQFSFFNSIFNQNINFLMTFFNLESKIQNVSNLDKLDYYDKIAKEELKDIKEEIKKNNLDAEKSNSENVPTSTISYLTHIRDIKDLKNYTSEEDCEDKGIMGMNEYDKDFAYSKVKKEDIDRELKTIQEFFKNSIKNTKYKNVSEVTKNIMTEELNSIHEVDSIEYCRNNKLFTGEMQEKHSKNNEYINLLRESVNNLFTHNEGESNLDVINEINNQGIPEEDLLDEYDENTEDDIMNYDDLDNNLADIENNFCKKTPNGFPDAKKSSNENSEAYKDNCADTNLNNNKFSNYNLEEDKKKEKPNTDDTKNTNNILKSNMLADKEHKIPETPIHLIAEDTVQQDILEIDEDIKEQDEMFESGLMESNYIIDITNAEKLKNFILKTAEVYDDDYDYINTKLLQKKYVQIPDPQAIFEFCANIMILTKMEKEVIITSLIYMERFIFNTGVLINSRNWKRILFTSLIIASKIWDDDSFENNHFAQVFTHLKIGEINLLERTFLELINYKVYVKCSEYFKYFFIIKSIALKYNFNGFNLVPISVERMMKVQEYAFLAQKKLRKKYSYNNSAEF